MPIVPMSLVSSGNRSANLPPSGSNELAAFPLRADPEVCRSAAPCESIFSKERRTDTASKVDRQTKSVVAQLCNL